LVFAICYLVFGIVYIHFKWSTLYQQLCFYHARWSAEKIFEVRHTFNGEKYVVNLDTRDCSCRKWSITRLPCCHSLAAMKFLNLDEEDFIPLCFKMSTYEETYQPIIYLTNGQHQWDVTEYPNVLPPPKRILPGRPKKKRRLEAWELKKKDKNVISVNRSGVRKKCGICMQIGHFRKTCPLRPKEYGPEPAPHSAPKSATAPTPDFAPESATAPTPSSAPESATAPTLASAPESATAPTPASVPDSAPATTPEFLTHPASTSELLAPASATQPAPATASQSATQNGPPPPSTTHEQATQITHGTESSQPVHQNLIPQPTRGRPFSRQKLQHRREVVWKP